MANSADPSPRVIRGGRWLGPVIVTLAGGAVLAGCVSTEQKSAWAHIEDARIIASQNPTLVAHAGRGVRVARIALLQTGTRLAIAVGLDNTTGHALNDLPISVGLLGPNGERTYLNRAAGLDYFKNHVAEIPAQSAVVWVFTGQRPRSPAGRPFAVIGSRPVVPVTVHSIPNVRALLAAGSGTGRGQVRVRVTNLSSIPQPQLQVYAFAVSDGRYRAAGSATIANLSTGSTSTTRVTLVGHEGARLYLEALPTLF